MGTIAASGSVSVSDINTVLGKSAGAQLSTSDSDFLALAGKTSGQSVTIPDDIYGALCETFTVTIGYNSPSGNAFGYSVSGGAPFGSIDDTTYRGNSFIQIASWISQPNINLRIYLQGGPYSQSLIRAVHIVEDDLTYLSPTAFLGGNIWEFGVLADDGPWTVSNVGETRTVKIYA